jgi:hypothetical protein
MAALDRIRLIGLLWKTPAQAGVFYVRPRARVAAAPQRETPLDRHRLEHEEPLEPKPAPVPAASATAALDAWETPARAGVSHFMVR